MGQPILVHVWHEYNAFPQPSMATRTDTHTCTCSGNWALSHSACTAMETISKLPDVIADQNLFVIMRHSIS